MTSTTHHAITDLAARLLIGALVLGILILMGVVVTRGDRASPLNVDALP
jgi:hypothetical protein